MPFFYKNTFAICTIILATYNPVSAIAEEWFDHSAYTITTYSTDSPSIGGEKHPPLGDKPLLLITGFHSDGSSGDYILGINTTLINNTIESSKSFIIAGTFDATSRLAITGAFGLTQNQWDSSFFAGEKESWEAHLGVVYKLFDNLSYEVHFGYKNTGDTYQKHSYDSTESIMMISNQISLSF